MTRVEPAVGTRPVGRDDVKEIVRRELFLEIFRRKFFSCLGYFFLLLLIIGLPTTLVAAFVAKTGFIEVPVFTAWLYEPVAPTRAVRPSSSSADVVMLSVGARSQYDAPSGLLHATIKENELTTLAVESLRSAPPAALPFAIKDLQVAIDPGVVEIFAVAPRESRDATVRIRLAPRLVGQSLELKLIELRLGSAVVPNSLAQSLVSVISRFVADGIGKELAAIGTLTAVEAQAGDLRITLIPKPR